MQSVFHAAPSHETWVTESSDGIFRSICGSHVFEFDWCSLESVYCDDMVKFSLSEC